MRHSPLPDISGSRLDKRAQWTDQYQLTTRQGEAATLNGRLDEMAKRLEVPYACLLPLLVHCGPSCSTLLLPHSLLCHLPWRASKRRRGGMIYSLHSLPFQAFINAGWVGPGQFWRSRRGSRDGSVSRWGMHSYAHPESKGGH